jgi:hypothetical protein
VARGPGPHLLAKLSSSVATRSSAPDLTSLPRWAPVLPCVPWLQALPPREESSAAAMCSSAPNLAFLPRWALALSCVPQLWTSPPREESSGAATYPTARSGLWTTGIKKGLTAPGMQLGSYVSKARSCVTETSARHAEMPLQFVSTVQHSSN